MLGFDALGRLALGQLPQSGNAQGLVVGVSGIGVAGTVRGSAATLGISSAVGIGVAGAVTANPAILLIGVAGTGVAGNITLRYVNFFGTAGVGIAGVLAPSGQSTALQAAGIGVAGILFNSEQAFLLGVSGGGVVGAIVGQSTAPVISQASGIGVAGQITANPGGNLLGAVGVGRAGIITVNISGGGGSAGATGDGERPPRKRRRTGLEPIAKRPDPPVPAPRALELPPAWVRSTAPPLAPVEASEQSDPHFQQEMQRIAMQIADAQDISDVLQLLDQLD